MQDSPAPDTGQGSFVIDGHLFNDIAGFYEELNRVFMAGETWKLGPSLDALDDMLYGGYGALLDAKPAKISWRAIEKSAADLGLAATRRWLTDKLQHSDRFNSEAIRAQIEQLESGTGKTYFDLVMEIFQDHPEIQLIPA